MKLTSYFGCCKLPFYLLPTLFYQSLFLAVYSANVNLEQKGQCECNMIFNPFFEKVLDCNITREVYTFNTDQPCVYLLLHALHRDDKPTNFMHILTLSK